MQDLEAVSVLVFEVLFFQNGPDFLGGKLAGLLQQGVWQKALVQYLQTLIGAADIRGIHLQGADSPLVQ